LQIYATLLNVSEIADLLTTSQVAKRVGRTVATVNRWAAEGRLKPALKLPGDTGAYLFHRADVDTLLSESAGAA